jgi:multidrug efflux pump subunit AcrA (membrane-fusion protein)
MIRTLLLPILAAAGVVFAVLTVRSGSQPRPVAAPVSAPAASPFESRIAGAGLVEASTQNIAIGTPVGGVVARVNVGVGDRVSAGDPLFVLDDRTVVARLAIDRAALAASEAALARLEAMPRPEEVPPAEARAREARAVLDDLQAQLEMWESLTDPRAVSAEELSKRRYAVRVSQAQFDQAQANLALLKAGAWKPDLDIARAQVEAARAQVHATRTELDRLTVRAPVDGQVLQVNLRPGEFAQAGALATPLMVLGDTRRLHVRVDIDENDAWRLDPRAPAQAALRGNPALKTPLSFVRVDPYVIPKRSLTGDSTERVDTRVLQVLYAFDPATLPAYVGQQVDVWIQAPPPDATAAAAGRAAADRGGG